MIERVALPRLTVNLGQLGENEHVRVKVPISEYTEQYPGAHFTLLNRPSGADSSYPVPSTETDENYLYWTVTSTDLVQPGYGKFQLIVLQGSTIAKSVEFDSFVGDALDDTGETPEPWDGWQVRFAGVVAEAEAASDSASGSASDAATAREAAERAQAASEAAQSASETAMAESQAAQNKAEEAQSKAEEAQTKTEEAQHKAETAQEEAENAQDKAETAQGRAETARDAAAASAGAALQSANTAALLENSAGVFARVSEGYAKGEQDGTPVTDGVYFRNNAKHYSEVAEQLADQASAAAQAIQALGVLARTLAPRSTATVTKTVDPENGAVTLTFGIPIGITPALSIGTVETVETYEEAGATLSGTPEAPVLNLTLPRGEIGLPGLGVEVVNHTLVITKNAR